MAEIDTSTARVAHLGKLTGSVPAYVADALAVERDALKLANMLLAPANQSLAARVLELEAALRNVRERELPTLQPTRLDLGL